MYSDLIEVAGFGTIVWGIYDLAGRGWAVLAAGIFLLFIGAVADDAAIGRSLRGLARAPFRLYAGWASKPTPRTIRSASDLPPSERPLSSLGE